MVVIQLPEESLWAHGWICTGPGKCNELPRAR